MHNRRHIQFHSTFQQENDALELGGQSSFSSYYLSSWLISQSFQLESCPSTFMSILPDVLIHGSEVLFLVLLLLSINGIILPKTLFLMIPSSIALVLSYIIFYICFHYHFKPQVYKMSPLLRFGGQMAILLNLSSQFYLLFRFVNLFIYSELTSQPSGFLLLFDPELTSISDNHTLFIADCIASCFSIIFGFFTYATTRGMLYDQLDHEIHLSALDILSGCLYLLLFRIKEPRDDRLFFSHLLHYFPWLFLCLSIIRWFSAMSQWINFGKGNLSKNANDRAISHENTHHCDSTKPNTLILWQHKPLFDLILQSIWVLVTFIFILVDCLTNQFKILTSGILCVAISERIFYSLSNITSILLFSKSSKKVMASLKNNHPLMVLPTQNHVVLQPPSKTKNGYKSKELSPFSTNSNASLTTSKVKRCRLSKTQMDKSDCFAGNHSQETVLFQQHERSIDSTDLVDHRISENDGEDTDQLSDNSDSSHGHHDETRSSMCDTNREEDVYERKKVIGEDLIGFPIDEYDGSSEEDS